MLFYLHYVMDQALSSASSKTAKWTENSNRKMAFLCVTFVFKLETVIIHFPAVSLVSDSAVFQMITLETKQTVSFPVIHHVSYTGCLTAHTLGDGATAHAVNQNLDSRNQ